MSAAAGVTGQGGAAGSRLRRWLMPGGLMVLVALLAVLSYRTTPQIDQQPYELESRGPYGLRGLRESLGAMGYMVRDLRGETLALPEGGDVLLSWPVVQAWTPEEILALRQWVASGRTAMVVLDRYDSLYALDEWGIDGYSGQAYPFGVINQSQPALPEGPEWMASARGSMYLDVTGRAVQVTELGDSEWRATAAVEQVGLGWIWYVSDHHAMTNADLVLPEQTALLAAVLRDVPEGGAIYFDAYHLYGSQATQEAEASRLRTLQQWLYFTPWGQATLLALVVGVVGWVMAGRRLGPPLKSARELKRREGAEYVRAIAGLKRRARAHNDIIQRQAQRLKLALGKPRHIAATLADAQYLDALRYSGDVEAAVVDEVAALLHRLRAVSSEEELVKVAAAVEEFLRRKP